MFGSATALQGMIANYFERPQVCEQGCFCGLMIETAVYVEFRLANFGIGPIQLTAIV